MTLSLLRSHPAVVLGVAALLAGCAAPSLDSAAPLAKGQILNPQWSFFALMKREAQAAARSERGYSWVSPDAARHDLLYVSDSGANQVELYYYPAGNLVGELKHLNDPIGLCTDSDRDVWIVSSAASQIVEYAHGSTKRKASLIDSGELNLLGCSVDPTTGNLAVTDLGGPSGGGSVSIYAGAQGTPTLYTDSALDFVYFCGYDDAGNLFVDGLNSSGAFTLAEMPSGSTSFRNIKLSGTVNFPGGVEWDGEYVAIGDQEYQQQHRSAIYQVSVTGSSGTVKGTTRLTNSCDVLQFAISTLSLSKSDQQGSSVVGPDVCQNKVGFYNYPAGGVPIEKLSGFQYPAGSAISLAKP